MSDNISGSHHFTPSLLLNCSVKLRTSEEYLQLLLKTNVLLSITFLSVSTLLYCFKILIIFSFSYSEMIISGRTITCVLHVVL